MNEDGRDDEREKNDRLGWTTRRRLLGTVGAGGAVVGGLAASRADASRLGGVESGKTVVAGIEPTLVEADSDAGFEHPYYLYAPPGIDRSPVSILVEPVNSGTPSDDFQQDLDAGKRLVRGGRPRQIADELSVPLVVPVFPNPRTGEHEDAFTQYLDVETMHIEEGPLARIDQQTLAMADHATGQLADAGIEANAEDLLLNGFSATGNFVNKLAALHPDRVASVTAGAVNGTAILPLTEAKSHQLPYQIGVADFESLIGESFDRSTWQTVEQLLYIGQAERPPNDDTLPYRGVWSAEQASVAYDVYGRGMQEERMPYCERAYAEADAPVRFEVYDDTGHSYSTEIVSDVIAFHRASLGLTDLRVVGTPTIGARTLDVELFVAEADAANPELDAYGPDGSVVADRVSVAPNTPTTETVQLGREIESGEELTAVVVPGDESRDEAVAADTATADARVALAERVVDGDESISVAYELADTASRATLSVVPAGAGPYYTRRLRLETVRPGTAATRTFELSPDETGVPFEAGEPVKVWLIPNGNQVPDRAVATVETTVSDPPGSVAFDAVPDAGSGAVRVAYGVADWYEGSATLRLETPDTTVTLRESVSAGTETTERITVPDAVTFERGERLTLRLVADEMTAVSVETLVGQDSLASVSVPEVLAGVESVTVGYETRAAIPGEPVVDLRDADGRSVAEEPVSVAAGESGETEIALREAVAIGDEVTSVVATTDAVVASERRRVRRIPSADVSFTAPPDADEASVSVSVSIDGEFSDERGRLRLFPDDGGGRYGIGLDFLDRGTETTETYELSQPLSRFELGTGIEVRLYPADWSYVEDVVALDRSAISGIRSRETVRPGDESVTFEYAVPDSVSADTTLRVTVRGETAGEFAVEPGESGERTVSLDAQPTAGDEVAIAVVDGDPLLSTTLTAEPEPGSVSFTSAPEPRGTSVAASVGLDADYDPDGPVDLRLYSANGSEFGTRLASVRPGNQRRETFDVPPREGEVPFESGEQVTLALVNGDDPYATAPLATARVAAGGSAPTETDTPTATDTETAMETATATDTGTQEDTITPTDEEISSDDVETTENDGATSATGALADWVPAGALAAVTGYLYRRARTDADESED